MKLRNHSDSPNSLLDIFEESDDLGLLDDLPTLRGRTAATDITVARFLEIVNFVESMGREPDPANEAEKFLAKRLSAYRHQPELTRKVLPYDRLGLIPPSAGETPHSDGTAATAGRPHKEVTSLEDIFDDDDLDLLDGIDTSIYQLQHVTDKDRPDEIGSRKPCEDFYKFERFFNDVEKAIRNKSVIVKRFSKEADVYVGQVFILRGLLCYIEDTLEEGETREGRRNPRLRLIFSNGTEANLLMRSLIRALYEDKEGRSVDFSPNLLIDKPVSITHRDRATGFIYILATESQAPELARWKNANTLVKIGYTTQDVQTRIRNAEQEPTYLEAAVRLLATISCFNLNPRKFEDLIHAFLHAQRLNITLRSSNGKSYHPEEWFTVDADTALKVCHAIIDGTITQYRMDNTTGKMVRKNREQPGERQ